MKGTYQNYEKPWSCFVLPQVRVSEKLKPFWGFVPVLTVCTWCFCISSQTAAGWTGCCWWVLHRHLTTPISLMLCRWVPMMFWAVLITRCRTLLSWAVHKPFVVLFPVRMLSIAHMYKLTRIWHGNFAFLSSLKSNLQVSDASESVCRKIM